MHAYYNAKWPQLFETGDVYLVLRYSLKDSTTNYTVCKQMIPTNIKIRVQK